MATVDPELQIEQYLRMFSSDIAALAQRLRVYLKKETQPTTELVGDSTISLNIGYGFTEKAWDCFCGIIVYSKHINISLPSGAGLNDPEGLMHGTGKRVRHLKLKSVADLQTKAARNILHAARQRALETLDTPPDPTAGTRTIIKEIKGVKKRKS